MLHQFKRNFLNVFLSILLLFVTGCSIKEKEEITFGDWIELINDTAGIQGYVSDRPYFINIQSDSKYYSDVQSAVEWGIIDVDHGLDLNEKLTRELVAYTLVNLGGFTLTSEDLNIRDIQKSNYRKYINCAISIGLLELDDHNRFRPQETLEREKAITLLNKVISYMNHIEFPNALEIEDDIIIQEIEPISFNEDSFIATFSKDTSINEDEYLKINDSYYEIISIEESDDEQVVYLNPLDELDLLDNVTLQGSSELDFSNAIILEDDTITEPTSYVEPTGIKLMSVRPLSKSFTFHGFNVTWKLTSSGVYAEIAKEDKFGGEAYANFTLSSVKPSFKWKMNDGQIEHAYFRIDYKTSEKVGFKNSETKNLYGNFKNLSASDFLTSCKNFFSETREVTKIDIPLGKIKVPIAGQTVVSLVLDLKLHLYASGKAEISFSQNGAVGMEIKNGVMRTIHDLEKDSTSVIKASTGATAKMKFSLYATNLSLMDMSLESGVEASVKATLHLFDENDDRTIVTSDLPVDYLDEVSDGNEDVLICGDLYGNWVLKAVINSSSSIAGKLGFTKTLSFLNKTNNSFLPFKKTHFENGHFVEKCTRKNRNKTTTSSSSILTSDYIRIQTYALVIKEGGYKTITIRALPEGYSLNDIEFMSSDPTIASVTGEGKVKAYQEGSTIIKVQTTDGKYVVSCSVLVQG